MNACVWALGRALAYAIATAVAAIVIASFVSGADAERFATTAYLAALVAAVILALQWFLPHAESSEPRGPSGPPFPAAFTFSSGCGALLLVGATFASQPGGEVLAIAACFGLIAAAALARSGAIAALNARLRRGDRLAAATRYAVAAAVAAMAVRAAFSSQDGDGLAKLAYAAIVVAAVAVGSSLIAPTAAGAVFARWIATGASALRAPESSRIFASTVKYAAATVVAAMLVASVAPEAYAERFTTTAYLATIFAALGIGMLWRLRDVAKAESRSTAPIGWPRFALVVGVLLAAGAALAFNPIAEALAVCACLYAIYAALLKSSRNSNAAA